MFNKGNLTSILTPSSLALFSWGNQGFLRRFFWHLRQIAFAVNIMISEAWVMKMVLRDGKHMWMSSQPFPEQAVSFICRLLSLLRWWETVFFTGSVYAMCVCVCVRARAQAHLCVFSSLLNRQCAQFSGLEMWHQERLKYNPAYLTEKSQSPCFFFYKKEWCLMQKSNS